MDIQLVTDPYSVAVYITTYMMKSNLTLKMNKDQTSSSQVAVLARILARFADLEDLNELNVANFITISS